MNKIKSIVLLVVRLLLVFIAMLIAFIVSALVIRTGIETPAEDASQAGIALLVVSLINSMVLGYLILRSRWAGIRLIIAMVVVHFGIETFMTQIETLYFINAVKMPMNVFTSVVLSGLMRALIFAPLAVLIFGKIKSTASDEKLGPLPVPEWIKRLALLAVVYAIVYFAFGYFVAWQSAELRQYYSGSTAIQPFLNHLMNTLTNDPILPLFQILRGVMWAALALLIVKMINRTNLETCLVVAVVFAVILASGVIFPNPFMPAMVRQAHFFELVSSMLTFGAVAGWVWIRQA